MDDKKKEEKPLSFWDKYYKIFAIIVLLFAIILLLYTVYRVVPKKVGGRKKLHYRGGSCGCAAGASQDNLPMSYGGVFRI